MAVDQVKKLGGEFTGRNDAEADHDAAIRALAEQGISKTGPQWNYHALRFLKRQVISRVIYLDMLYKQILDVPGVVCEFGVHWGGSLSVLMNLRGIYEPFNHSRRLIGFDTFSGFPGVDAADGGRSSPGDYSVEAGYEVELEQLLTLHEQFSPISHIKKFELVKGDVEVTLETWLAENPAAVISLAIFDMDIYRPTKTALAAVLPRLTKGSVLVFDELNCPHFPGETQAVQEVLGLNNLRLRRFPHQPYAAWAVYGE